MVVPSQHARHDNAYLNIKIITHYLITSGTEQFRVTQAAEISDSLLNHAGAAAAPNEFLALALLIIGLS
jgi:hypothetical protein